MLEKAWGGLMEHTEQGFNIGKPPYGYQVVVEKHPVPAKAALGKVKRRLVRDPCAAPSSRRSTAGGSSKSCPTTTSPTGSTSTPSGTHRPSRSSVADAEPSE